MFDANQPGSPRRPALLTEPVTDHGLERLWAACEAASTAEPSAETIRRYLETHVLVWDMPSLCDVFPEVALHLEARYSVEPTSRRVTVAFADGREPETFGTDDVRAVVTILLARELQQALARERV